MAEHGTDMKPSGEAGFTKVKRQPGSEFFDNLPLTPAVTAAMSVPTRLRDRASLAHL